MSKDAWHKFLARAGEITGIHSESIQLQEDFQDLAARFANLPGTVVLLSGGDLDCARYHVMGAWPWLTLSGRAGQTRLYLDGRQIDLPKSPLAALRGVMRHFHSSHGQWPVPVAAGLMGYLAYDLKDDLERLPRTSVDDLQLPHMLFYAPSIMVVHDRRTRITRLMIPRRTSPAAADVHDTVRRFRAVLAAPAPALDPFDADAGRLASNFTQAAYQEAVSRIIDYITAGDVYQVNLSQRFQVPCSGDSYELFRRLFQRNPAPFFAFVQAGGHQVVSTSPERFIQRRGSAVEARPIKGTRPRGQTPREDRDLRQELAGSPKDDAELSMIVDLLRNDLGKACAAGSVKVAEHKRLEAYENVYHLVSVVKGMLDAGRSSVDLVEAAFPGGSITGCPKVRSMEIIDELETARRHVYCGSLGYLGFDDVLDLSIAIRTATTVNGMMVFSVGGGIVYDSDPEDEYEETLHKGRTLLSACRGAARRNRGPVVWHNGRLTPQHEATVPVSDQGLLYGFGFFETLRADHGRVPLLERHRTRFEEAWHALMPSPAPDLCWSDIIGQVLTANGLKARCAAVKILATRGSRTSEPWDHTLLVTAWPYVHRLTAIGRPGLHLGTYPHPRQTPLAAHKTLNYLYYLQAGQWARQHEFDEALILNPDATVSETNTANLLLINGSRVTRPDSPAVLPGVMTRAACGRLEKWGFALVDDQVSPEALSAADQVLATNALMGVVSVVRIDGQARPPGDDLWMRLNDELIPGWRD